MQHVACARASRMMKSQWQAINGHFWYMQTARMIRRNLGKDCFRINCLFGSVLCLQPLNIVNWLTNLQLPGLQAYIYFSELSWPWSQSNKVQECLHSQYDKGNDRVTCVCCHASTSLKHYHDCSLSCNLLASICSIICISVLSIQHFNGLWKFLCHCIGVFRGSGRKGWSRWPPKLVELVRHIPLIYILGSWCCLW